MKNIARLSCLLIGLFLTISAFSIQGTVQSITPTVAKSAYNPGLNTVAGNPKGNVTLVEIFDYNCSQCRKLQPILEELIQKNPNLRVVYKEYLLFGDFSLPATKAALAAQFQNKYLTLHKALLSATQPLTEEEVLRIAKAQGLDIAQLKADMGKEAILDQIRANNALTAKLKLDGAPIVIVTNSNIANDPEKHIKQPQYIQMGFDNALTDIQAMIDKVKG